MLGCGDWGPDLALPSPPENLSPGSLSAAILGFSTASLLSLCFVTWFPILGARITDSTLDVSSLQSTLVPVAERRKEKKARSSDL